MKKTFIYFILLIILLSIFLYLRNSNQEEINSNLILKENTLNEIVNQVSPYVTKYYGNSNYHLGKIAFSGDDQLKGELRLTFARTTSKKLEPVEVLVNTFTNKIINLESIGNEENLDPGEIFYKKWKVDYNDAYVIAKKSFVKDFNLNYDKVLIVSDNFDEELLKVTLYDSVSKKAYWYKIDPYSGKEINFGVIQQK